MKYLARFRTPLQRTRYSCTRVLNLVRAYYCTIVETKYKKSGFDLSTRWKYAQCVDLILGFLDWAEILLGKLKAAESQVRLSLRKLQPGAKTPRL